MRYSIGLEPARCIACGACAVACMDENDTDLFLRRVETRETGRGTDARMEYLSLSCRHCEDAPCIGACPLSCIRRDPDTGFVVCDDTDCVGCGACVRACPVSAPVLGPDGKMHKCDGCADRVKRGLLPACVRVCPMDALQLTRTQ